jgi:hypothetical protein
MSTKPKGGLLKWGVASVVLLAGGLLLYTAIPRIAAHGALLQAGAAIRAIDGGAALPPDAAEAAYRSYTVALAWRGDDPALLKDRARLAGRLASADPQSAVAWRARAVEDLRAALALAPGDGTAWARLAQAEIEAGADVQSVLPHLRLARLTAPRRASALLPQFSIVMRHWDAMPDELRTHALEDLSSFWSRRALRPLLVTAYLDAGLPARAAFRVKLGENERALRDFDRLLVSSLGL